VEPPDAPPELGPLIEPPPLGAVVEPLECGAVLLPDEPLGPQSFIAVVLLLSLAVVPLLELGLVVLPELLEPGLLAAALLPGGQSLLDKPPEGPDIEPLVPAPVPDLPVVAPVDPVVLLVCAIAAVPRVNAMIEVAVRRRRFIRSPPLKIGAPPGGSPRDARPLTAGCSATFRSILKVDRSRACHDRSPVRLQRSFQRPEKKKGRIEMRPKFREEKPEGLAARSGGPARTARSA
jgi:hypothetical protein